MRTAMENDSSSNWAGYSAFLELEAVSLSADFYLDNLPQFALKRCP
jgi:hypothetical protein